MDRLQGGYGSKAIFREISFQVKHGEVLAILGQNGSGKSTLLKTLAGLLTAQGGNFHLGGGDGTLKVRPHALVRSGISYCPQQGLVMGDLSVAEHLQLATIHLPKSTSAEAQEEALKAFPAIKHILGQRAGTLSGGQRQQLSLAMLVANRTKLWLLDEPTSGLAPSLVKQTTDFLRERVHAHGTALILVEHNLSVALALADSILVLREGQVVRTITNVQASNHQLDHEQIYY